MPEDHPSCSPSSCACARSPTSWSSTSGELTWAPDGRGVLFAKGHEREQIGYSLALAPLDGGGTRLLLDDYEGTVMRALWPLGSELPLVQAMESCRSVLLEVDPSSGQPKRLADFCGTYPSISSTRDGTQVAYVADTPQGPPEVWRLRIGSHARRVTDFNPQAQRLRVGDFSEITWSSSRDGMPIHGVIVKPSGYEPGSPYPAVVQVHGGPHLHWGLGWLGSWHDWARMLASRGYVVLLPNPRGSTGRGWPFAKAIVRDIGGIDYQDIIDGADELVSRGIADPERLGVGGWSYGGFMTAWIITQTDRFRAAVVGAGICDIVSHTGVPGTGRKWSSTYFAGDVLSAQQAYRDRSPVAHLRNVTTPTLVLHGQNDAKVSPNQAWQLYTGLQAAGVESELVLYPREGHRIHERAHQVDFLQRMADWFDQHLGSDR